MGAAAPSTRGFAPGRRRVTLFAGEGPRGVVDQLSRDAGVAGPLARRLPAHRRTTRSCRWLRRHAGGRRPSTPGCSREAGWTKARLRAELDELLQLAGQRDRARRRRDRRGHARARSPDATLPKFRPDGLLVVHAGGGAGLFSADHRRLGATGEQPVSRGRGRDTRRWTSAHDEHGRPRPHRRARAPTRPALEPPGGARRADASACSTSPSRAATCSSTGSRSSCTDRGARGAALRQADVHQAAPGRPAPRDRRARATW